MKARKRPGQTLVEVTVAALIAAVTATAVFSVVLSSFVSDAKGDKRDAAAMVLRSAQETLKSYVSAVPTTANMFPGFPARPGAPGSPVGRWSADGSGGWALAAGSHNLDSLVSGPPLTEPGNPPARLRYTVTNTNCLGALGPAPTDFTQCKTVNFTLIYTD